MGSKSNRSRRYTEEFKRNAVALVHSSRRTVTEVSRELGVGAEGLRNWVKQDAVDEGPIPDNIKGWLAGSRVGLLWALRAERLVRAARATAVSAAAWMGVRSPRGVGAGSIIRRVGVSEGAAAEW
ncbi:transposase [Streptomyces sp. NPDC007883]|uniref:transposase n=1 Tax=Streptomyces sp. NPDC007883 TaxID=3155116 RepID=UPI0033CF36A5